MEKDCEEAPRMFFQEPLSSRTCHWKDGIGEPSESVRLCREAERVFPSNGVPEISRFAVAGLSRLRTLEEDEREMSSAVPC